MIFLLAIAAAQEPAEPLFEGPATSDAALTALRGGEKLTARRIATTVLKSAPTDYISNYVVAKVYWQEDANLPRALYHYKIADKQYSRHRSLYGDEESNLHCFLLQDLSWVAEDIDDSSLYYDTLDRYNAECTPKMHAERGWRLMKDERYEEARQVGRAGLASDDQWQVALGGNVMCALEALLRNRPAAAKACDAVVERNRAEGFDLTVDAYNASTANLSNLNFQRADEWLTLATKGAPGGTTNPWLYALSFYLQQGRGTDAIQAAKKMQRWRHAQEPADRVHSRAEADAALALLLLAAGATDDGIRVIERALQRPDRRSGTTATEGTTLAAHTLVHLALRRVAAERAAEENATQNFLWRSWFGLKQILPDPLTWEDELVIQGVFTDRKIFEATFAVYHDNGIPVPPWLLSDLIPLLGPGVVQAELDHQRQVEQHSGIHAYYDAIEAEVAWHRGQPRGVELAEQALETLPQQEVLLRGRVAAIGADLAWRSGRVNTALGLYERALQLDPGAIRRLGLALPATVVSVGGEVADDAAAMLSHSPRVQWSRSGFQIRVETNTVCILTAGGSQIGCVNGPNKSDSPAADLVRAWHEEAFSIPLNLSRLDMRSLDGTTRLDENARRNALKSLIGDF